MSVKLRKLLSVHKSHVREISLSTGAIPNLVRNSQTSRFVSVPGQNPGRSSWGDSVVLRLQSVMMADVWWCRSGTPPPVTYSAVKDHLHFEHAENLNPNTVMQARRKFERFKEET